MEIGNIDLPTVMHFTAECEAHHPFEAPFFVGNFSFVLVIFYVLGLMPTMQRELNEETLQKYNSSCLFTFFCSTLEILKHI